MRVSAVEAGDGFVLEDACNTGEAATGSPASASRAATTTGSSGLHGGSLTTVTLTVNAACGDKRTDLSLAPALPKAHPGWPSLGRSQLPWGRAAALLTQASRPGQGEVAGRRRVYPRDLAAAYGIGGGPCLGELPLSPRVPAGPFIHVPPAPASKGLLK